MKRVTKFAKFGLLLGIPLLIASCGGGGGSSAPNSPLIPSTGNPVTVVSSTSTTVTASNPIAADGDTTVSVSRDVSVLGGTFAVQHVSDPTVDAAASNDAPALGTVFSTANTIRLIAEFPPAADDLTITIATGSTYSNLATNQGPVIYVWQPAGDVGDGDDEFVPLNSSLDQNSGNLTATLPTTAFHPDLSLGNVAEIKVGLAELQSSPTPTVAASALRQFKGVEPHSPQRSATVAGAVAGASLFPCPLPSCTERSMFNLKRYLPGSTSPGHYGVDLVAATPKAVVPPIGGTIIRGLTQGEHADQLNGKDPNTTPANATLDECNTGAGAGVFVVLHYASLGVNLKYIHLQSLNVGSTTSFPVNSSTTYSFNKNYFSDGTTPIGTTGATGRATQCNGKVSPHLHMELYTNSVETCRTPKGQSIQICSYSEGQRDDPFIQMFDNFKFTQPQGNQLLTAGARYSLGVQGKDVGGKILSSDVQNPYEIGDGSGYLDPTRKLCFVASAPSNISFESIPGLVNSSGPNGYFCGAWSSTFAATAQSNTPTTLITGAISVNPTVAISSDSLSVPGIGNTVTLQSTELTVTASASPSIIASGGTSSLTAIVNNGSGGAIPTGSITFSDPNSADLCTVPLSGGSASCTATINFTGMLDVITANYSGDTNYMPNIGETTISLGPCQGTLTSPTICTFGSYVLSISKTATSLNIVADELDKHSYNPNESCVYYNSGPPGSTGAWFCSLPDYVDFAVDVSADNALTPNVDVEIGSCAAPLLPANPTVGQTVILPMYFFLSDYLGNGTWSGSGPSAPCSQTPGESYVESFGPSAFSPTNHVIFKLSAPLSKVASADGSIHLSMRESPPFFVIAP